MYVAISDRWDVNHNAQAPGNDLVRDHAADTERETAYVGICRGGESARAFFSTGGGSVRLEADRVVQ